MMNMMPGHPLFGLPLQTADYVDDASSDVPTPFPPCFTVNTMNDTYTFMCVPDCDTAT